MEQPHKTDRRRIRRLVRVGRPVETSEEAELAVSYAAFQNNAAWRLFWFWFVPGLVIALLAAMSVHAILVGVVLAAGANAIFVHRNLRRVTKIDACVLDPPPRVGVVGMPSARRVNPPGTRPSAPGESPPSGVL